MPYGAAAPAALQQLGKRQSLLARRARLESVSLVLDTIPYFHIFVDRKHVASPLPPAACVDAARFPKQTVPKLAAATQSPIPHLAPCCSRVGPLLSKAETALRGLLLLAKKLSVSFQRTVDIGEVDLKIHSDRLNA